jgi:hypothetical protein
MNCYDCQPNSTTAVAVCVACGKGVCMEHCVRHDRQVVERVTTGMAAQDRPTGRKVPRMLCGECAAGTSGSPCPQTRGRND